MTRTIEQSLRYAVEKWLGFRRLRATRITASRRSAATGKRYVCIATMHGDEHFALFFFRHDGGCWRVFPPARTMPAMAYERLAA